MKQTNSVTISFVILPNVPLAATWHVPYSGQVQPADGSSARCEVDGPAGRGLPLLQAHAGQRAPRHPPHGNAAREEKIITQIGWVEDSHGHVLTFLIKDNYFRSSENVEVLGKTDYFWGEIILFWKRAWEIVPKYCYLGVKRKDTRNAE